MRKRRAEKNFIYKIMVLAVLVVLLFTTGGLMARYVTIRSEKAEMVSSAFHLTGEYLEEVAQNYEMTTWDAEGIVIPLYNFEKTNTALVSDVDIIYEVNVDNGSCAKVLNGSEVVMNTGGTYKMEKIAGGGKVTHMLHIVPNAGASSMSVTVHAVKPYDETLSVNIALNRKQSPEWKVTDKGNYVEIMLKSNDWAGQITVKWGGKSFAPDNLSAEVPAMSSWVSLPSGQSLGDFMTDAHTSYKIVFFKKNDQPYTGAKEGIGPIIDIGGDQ